ncbi:helix-turn-helix transcriptional regulator [Sphaerochaeta halotolerans]|jgi:AraC-like DNA-binding protein|uniref:helix-turn-helix transcriptional regulator n=1 Tax=Sphaerochaeta halotolerans TaxID=2293840 RepID=UPI00136DF112|nr:AraC family transcriptional regulator [Sphaerochaeta halotolerans]MXI85225.1 helix-turn-helix domain-containing protein [Sphaerochaeta halotolerans]
MQVMVPLGRLPRIEQAGLSLHGHLKKEQFLMHGVWGLHVYFYSGKLRFQGEEFNIRSGTASITPPDTPLEWEFPDHAPHYYIHFVPGSSCGEPTDSAKGEDYIRPFQVINGPFEYFDTYVRDMELIGSICKEEPLRASVCLWNLLWRISDSNAYFEPPQDSLPSSVQIAVSHINQNYSTPIVIEELAAHSGVSHNYLILLFKEHFGCTIEAYIRRKRCRQAEFLLRHSSLTIKSIAQAVGIPDINHFNKTIRKELGAAPSKIRGSRSNR